MTGLIRNLELVSQVCIRRLYRLEFQPAIQALLTRAQRKMRDTLTGLLAPIEIKGSR